MTKHIFKSLLVSAVMGLSVTPVMAAECVAPANPGGGWDFTCRQIGKIMYDIGAVEQPIQVTNMAGGGGLAFSYVVAERNTDLIVAASSATSTRLAQNAYAGMTADPKSVTFAGGSAVDGFDHMKPLMLLQRAGLTDITTVKYIGLDGGGDAITQTIGGFTQAMTGDMSEIVGFLAAGNIRVLAVLTDERVPGFGSIPTAKEQGYDVVAGNWRGLYIPRGVSDETFQMWAGRLQQVAGSDEWKKAMADNGLAPFIMVGDEFQGYIDNLIVEIRQMSKDIGVIQ